MITEFVEDLFHFKGRCNGLEKRRRSHRANGEAEILLCRRKYVVPECRLFVVLQFRNVVVGTGSFLFQGRVIVKQVDGKIENAPRRRYTIDKNVRFIQVPSPGTHKERRNLFMQGIHLVSAGKGNGPGDRIAQVDLSLHDIFPCGSSGIFKVGHVDGRSRVETVDDHFAIHRARNFDAAILNVRGNRSALPVTAVTTTTTAGMVAQKGGKLSRVKGQRPRHPCGQERLAPRIKGGTEGSHKAQAIGGEDFRGGVRLRRQDLDVHMFRAKLQHDQECKMMIRSALLGVGFWICVVCLLASFS